MQIVLASDAKLWVSSNMFPIVFLHDAQLFILHCSFSFM
jgi:hypothetical protein